MEREVKRNSRINDAKKLERDLRQCMKCRFFWGNDSRCISGDCIKKEKPVPLKITECTDCPYKQSNGYCFPCMKRILEKKKDKKYAVELIAVEDEDG